MIRRGTVLVGLVLFVAMGAAAQRSAGVGSDRDITYGIAPTKWQITEGYQFNLIDLNGKTFNTNGMNTSVERYFADWFGLEGQVGMGFGNTGSTTAPANLDAKSLFLGAGPRFAYRGHWRFEPWIHVLAGMERFRFTQTAGNLGSNTAFGGLAGVGVDVPVYPRTELRLGVDALGTTFFGQKQGHFQAVAALAFTF
jgi:hypothetical protein